jgi:auxin response factor
LCYACVVILDQLYASFICFVSFFSEDMFHPFMNDLADDENDVESAFKRAMPWFADNFALKDVQNALFPGLNLVQWMAMQQNPQMLTTAAPAVQSQYLTSNALGMQDGMGSANEDPTKRLSMQARNSGLPNIQGGSKADHSASTLSAQHQQQQQAHHVLQQQQVQPLQQNSAILQQQQAQLLQQNSVHLHQQQEQLQWQQPQQQLKAAACFQPMDQHKLKEQQPSSGQVVSQAQLLSQILQPSSSQLQQLGLPKSPTQRPGLPGLTTVSSLQQPPLTHSPQVQPTAEFQQALLQGQQPQLQQLSQSELQLQLLQKIQQQNLLSQLNPQHQSQLIQQLSQKSQEILQQQVLQHQFSSAEAMGQLKHLQQTPLNHITGSLTAQQLVRSHSVLNESEEPSSSTAPSGSRMSPINSLSRAHQGRRNLPEMPATPQIDHFRKFKASLIIELRLICKVVKKQSMYLIDI